MKIKQEPDEPRLAIRIYWEKADRSFYFRLESNSTPFPSPLLRIYTVTNFTEAKSEAEKFLKLQRAILRYILGKSPDLPEDMKVMEAAIPAFLHFLNTDKAVGKMAETLELEWMAGGGSPN